MSINLTLEKPDSPQEEPPVRYTKRIDDLIEDAEIEAEIEAERKVRAKNTKIVAISVVAIGLLGFLYYGIQSQSFSPDKSQKAEAPKVAQLTPKAAAKPAPASQETNAAAGSTVPEIKPVAKTPATPAKLEPAKPAEKAPVKTAKAPVAESKSPSKKISFSSASKTETTKTQKPTGTPLNALSLPPARTLQTPVKSAGTAAGGYFVQVGAFSSKANASRMANKLKSAGFTPTLGTKTVNNKTVNVVKIGGFESSGQAKSARSDLNRAGFKNSFVFFSKQG